MNLYVLKATIIGLLCLTSEMFLFVTLTFSSLLAQCINAISLSLQDCRMFFQWGLVVQVEPLGVYS